MRTHTSSSWLVNSLCSFSFSVLLLFILRRTLLSRSLGLSSSSSPSGVFRFCFFFSSRTRFFFEKRPPANSPRAAAVLLTRASHYFGYINDKQRYFFVFLKERKREKSAVSGVFCAVRYSSPFPGKLLRRVLLLFPKRNTVNGHRTAPQANFSPLFSA